MTRHVAFLRAINVGGHVVKMTELRKLCEMDRFTSVETFIASGNVIFDTTSRSRDAIERKIERRLREALGYEVVTFARTLAEVAAISRIEPFGRDEPASASNLYVSFLKEAPSPAARKRLLQYETDVDRFRVRGREAYWLCRTTLSQSNFSGALLERALGPSTMRNITTVRKLAARYPPR